MQHHDFHASHRSWIEPRSSLTTEPDRAWIDRAWIDPDRVQIEPAVRALELQLRDRVTATPRALMDIVSRLIVNRLPAKFQ